MAQANIKPKYEVEFIDKTVTRTKFERDNDKGMNVAVEVEEPYGYNVYFPAGHSIRVKNEEELKRLGFQLPPELIDMESGDVVGEAQTSLKQQVRRRAGASARADTTAVAAEQGD